METVTIREVEGSQDLPAVRTLLEEYWTSLGFGQETFGFGEEIEGLPGEYQRPSGRLALALVSDQIAGCVALRKLSESSCEMKRLFVRKDFRGKGVATVLLEWLMSEARAQGYTTVMADTLPTMESALKLYQHLGFERTEPYSAHPTPGAIYLRKGLALAARNRSGQLGERQR